jgi:hypothetical protein
VTLEHPAREHHRRSERQMSTIQYLSLDSERQELKTPVERWESVKSDDLHESPVFLSKAEAGGDFTCFHLSEDHSSRSLHRRTLGGVRFRFSWPHRAPFRRREAESHARLTI